MLAAIVMEPAPSQPSAISRRNVCAGILIVGTLLAVISFQEARQHEFERAEAEFGRRASIRHTLSREVIGRYEDALFGLTALFMLDGNVTRSEFQRATQLLEDRGIGAQAFEWVPFVPHEKRAEVEATLQRYYPRRDFEFIDIAADGRHTRAPERPAYYPIVYIQPLAGNDTALGYDLTVGPSREFLERARTTRRTVVTHQIRLVQEKGSQLGVIMILPIYRPPKPAQAGDPDTFMGFVQGVFRVHDLLELTRTRHPDTNLDLLFIDGSERDPANRLLYYRPADDRTARTPAPTEAEFRGMLSREFPIPMGGRDWRVLYRPRSGWLEEQFTWFPWMRLGGVLTITLLLVGLIHTVGRRSEDTERQVTVRTAELHESRRQLDSMLHALPGMAYRCHFDDRLSMVYLSEGALALTGYPAAEFIAGRIHFRELVHPDDLERVRVATRTALQERRDLELEYRLRGHDGTEKWVLSRGRGIYTDDGQLSTFEGLAIDITAQKQAELGRLALERKLLEGQKLESLGLLAGGIAHDFNNLLTGILGNASLARLALPIGTPIDPQLHAIETASLRAAELCRQMLAYAGKGRFVVEPIDLTLLAEGLVPLLEISIAHQARLHLALDRRLPAVMADATQLRQIMMNLVINSADAIGSVTDNDDGEITLSTGLMTASRATLATAVAGMELPEGDYVYLEVRDNGCGMTPEVRAKIFDPFFTTKFAGRGLGLAATLGIVRGHQGALLVESAPGRGSTFRLLLPPTRGVVPLATTSAASAPGHWQRPGQVLLIDDDEAVRTVAAGLLRTFGLTVRIASDGHAGLAAYRENPGAIDLVLLDLLMPGLSGEETLNLLRGIRPGVRVLLISGYSEGNTLATHTGRGGPLAFLQKPFTRGALEEKLRELLG